MKRNNRGIILLCIGVCMLLISVGWYALNILEDKNAGKKSEEIVKKMKISQSEKQVDENKEPQFEQNELPVMVVDGEAFCGRVIIDKLDMELPVYQEWNYVNLKQAPCRYTGSVRTDNMIIAGHNYDSHFGDLKYLEIGDKVTFVDAYGVEHYFEVREMTVLGGMAVSVMQSGEWDLTLFTCTIGGEKRVTVRCDKIDEDNGTVPESGF